jgi:hypothetical protein
LDISGCLFWFRQAREGLRGKSRAHLFELQADILPENLWIEGMYIFEFGKILIALDMATK